jgi:hypothetical protein
MSEPTQYYVESPAQAKLRQRMHKLRDKCAVKLGIDGRMLSEVKVFFETFVWDTVYEGLQNGDRDTKILDHIIKSCRRDGPLEREDPDTDDGWSVDNGHLMLIPAVAWALILLDDYHGRDLAPNVVTEKTQDERDKMN